MILTIDIGSSSTRVALFDHSGMLVPGSVVRQASAFRIAADGMAEDDPQLLLGRVASCLDQATAWAAQHNHQIEAVATATYAMGLLGIDADGTPCTPIFTYADTRSTDTAAALRQAFDEQDWWERTGCPLRPGYAPALFAWLQRSRPAMWAQVARWLTIGEWLYLQLFGRADLALSAASWTGLVNRHTGQWDDVSSKLFALDAARWSSLTWETPVQMGLSAAWAGRWPALRQLPWLSAISDGIAATLGSGVTDATRIAMSIGTSGALRVWLPHVPRIPPGLWCYRADQRHALLGGATNAGGNVLAWALATLQLDAPTLDAWLLDPAGADHGLIVLPFLAGERSPGWAGDITATIHGLRGNTSARDIARAAIEAVTYEWATIAALLRLVAPQATEISVSGGGSAHLPAWAQLIADALGLTVAVSSAAEATSRGLALLALQSLHPTAALAAAPAPWSGRHVPDDARHAAHRNAMLQQRALYERLGYDLE